jgi:alkaline phosphatase D
VFGQGTYELNAAWSLTAGLRYTKDDKTIVADELNAAGASKLANLGGAVNREESWNAMSGRVSLEWNAAEDIFLFTSWARGFRAGGFNDHEVVNDYWQSYSNAGPLQTLKLASNQAWAEYMPAALSRAAAGPAGYNPAHDFEFAEVANVAASEFDDNYLSTEANNLKAINSLAIYRSLKWGKLADLFLVDGRSYRGARGLDSGILGTDSVSYPANPIDPQLVEILNAGRSYNGGQPPETINYEGKDVPNPRKDSPRGSMLGADQKQWLKDGLGASKANWRVLFNNVPMMRFGFDTRNLEHGVKNGLYFTDGWDGYPVERRELLAFIRDQQLANVVSLSGDRHAQYAGLVMDDFDAESPQPVIPELVGTSVSALSRLQLQKRLAKGDAFFENMAAVKAPDNSYLYPEFPTLNGWMLYGAEAAEVFNKTLDEEQAKQSADPSVNPHLAYADNDAYGYFSVTITEDNMLSEFVSQPQPLTDYTNADQQPVRRRVFYTVPSWQPGEQPRIELTDVKGEPPILGLKKLQV